MRTTVHLCPGNLMAPLAILVVSGALVLGGCGDDGGTDTGAVADLSTEAADLATDDAAVDAALDLAEPGDLFSPDLRPPPCANTTLSCGQPGACTDCSANPAGKVCIDKSCGCTISADCPRGRACNSKLGYCTTACGQGQNCNGGCCASGTCAAGDTATACALGPTCASCTGDAAGSQCITTQDRSFCGCNTAADCPANRACDKSTRQCTTRCGTDSPCNGGCCSAPSSGICLKGTDPGACGTNGVCSSCLTGSVGKICQATQGGGQCGCSSLADCPSTALACTGGLCDTRCTSQTPCRTGCCAGGTCVAGTSDAACGKSGACLDCTNDPRGRVCRSGTSCGCAKSSDCPAGASCNLTTGICETRCSATQPCSTGCCSASNLCVAGTDGNACGAGGGACLDCTGNPKGKACVGGTCGCSTAADCPTLQSCDPVKKQCTTSCAPGQPCNGGCCAASGTCAAGNTNSACGGTGEACAVCKDGTPTCENNTCTPRCGAAGNGSCAGGFCCSSGMCVAGNQQKSCGYGGTCLDCTRQSTGTRCVAPTGSNDWVCGCEARTDCFPANTGAGIPGYACDTVNKSCTSLCGIQGVSACNGGCCSGPSGSCRAGNQDSACGLGGGFCTSCSNSCNPGPKCNPATGACGCDSPSQCNNVATCYLNGANRFGCDYVTSSCCVPGIYSFKDNGNPAGCCTGVSNNGSCTCLLNGGNPGNPANPWTCCSLNVVGGLCACLGTGGNANFGLGAEPRACCSNRVSGNNCICSPKGGTCQTQAGCCAGTICTNGVCV